jgi:hypothetical protein
MNNETPLLRKFYGILPKSTGRAITKVMKVQTVFALSIKQEAIWVSEK